MPTKAPKASKTSKAPKIQKPTKAGKPPVPPTANTTNTARPTGKKTRSQPEIQGQMNLFNADLQPAFMPAMVTIQVPAGVSMSFGAPASAVPTQPTAQVDLSEAMRAILSLPRDQIRQTLEDAGATAAQVINLSTTAHGLLYRLAAIGGKVTQRGPRGPRGPQEPQG